MIGKFPELPRLNLKKCLDQIWKNSLTKLATYSKICYLFSQSLLKLAIFFYNHILKFFVLFCSCLMNFCVFFLSLFDKFYDIFHFPTKTFKKMFVNSLTFPVYFKNSLTFHDCSEISPDFSWWWEPYIFFVIAYILFLFIFYILGTNTVMNFLLIKIFKKYKIYNFKKVYLILNKKK